MDINIVKILLILIGSLFACISILFFIKCTKLKTWIPIELIDLKTGIKKEKELALYTNLMFKYIPYANYKYVIDGSEYNNSNVSVDKNREWSYYKDKANNLLKMIENSEIAYVNPKDYSESLLLKTPISRSKSHHMSLLIVGLLLFGIGII